MISPAAEREALLKDEIRYLTGRRLTVLAEIEAAQMRVRRIEENIAKLEALVTELHGTLPTDDADSAKGERR